MTLEYSRALQLMDVDVRSVCAPETDVERVHSAEFPVITAHSPRARLSYKSISELKAVLLKERPDVVLTHNNRESLNVKAARFFSGLQTPIIHVAHCERPRYMKHTADGFIAVSEGVSTALNEIRIPSKLIRVCENFISASHNTSVEHSSFPSNKPVIGFLGRLCSEKNPFLFIDLIEELHNRGVDSKGLIAGDGKNRWRQAVYKHKEVAANADIEFMGWVDDIDAFFSSIDVLVVPSKEEAFGLVILEAMARGVPVVATRTSGSKVIIQNGQNGLETEHSVNHLADAVESLVCDEELYDKIIGNAFKTFENYSTENKAADLLNRINDLSLTVSEMKNTSDGVVRTPTSSPSKPSLFHK